MSYVNASDSGREKYILAAAKSAVKKTSIKDVYRGDNLPSVHSASGFKQDRSSHLSSSPPKKITKERYYYCTASTMRKVRLFNLRYIPLIPRSQQKKPIRLFLVVCLRLPACGLRLRGLRGLGRRGF